MEIAYLSIQLHGTGSTRKRTWWFAHDWQSLYIYLCSSSAALLFAGGGSQQLSILSQVSLRNYSIYHASMRSETI
jgi:hypothetical protein